MTVPTNIALRNELADRYELGPEIGRGGMASVYLARDRRHERDVAVKVLLPELVETIGTDRFLREIRLVARLQHPHILPLFDSGEAAGQLYFVMPYVDGESLRARLDRDGALSLDVAVRLLRQIADALDYAHARGVVHRDLKPENILLTGDQALLADFGIARGVPDGAATSETLSSHGVALGTPAYMSPEQVVGEREIDGRSDVYALGCNCYEMLSGRPPFTGSSAMAVLRQHMMAEPELLVGALTELPEGVTAAVARSLAKEPIERFAGAGDFIAAIEQAMVESRQMTGADQRLRAVELEQDARERVLVLAFTNIARAADADWLSIGIAETLSSDLSRIAGLKVIGQDAATRRRIEAELRGRVIDAALAAERGRTAGARWVVFGAYQKSGSRIRITPHFIDSTNGDVLGGVKIDGDMGDIFALQDRIVLDLADVLRIQLTSGEVAHIARPETASLTAYELYANGYQEFVRFGTDSVRMAAEHFRAAIALDPDYAMAHVGLGSIHGPMYIASGRKEVLDEGARLLERAVALDPSSGEAHAWLAYMAFRQGRFDLALHTSQTAVSLEPTSETAWYMLGCSHVCEALENHRPAGLVQGVQALLRATSLNRNGAAGLQVLGWTYLTRGQHSFAAPIVQHAVDLELHSSTHIFHGGLILRAVLHLAEDDVIAAAVLLDQAIERYPATDHVFGMTMTAYAHFMRGCCAERTGALESAAVDFLRACEIADANEHRITIGAHWVKSRYGLARVYHRMGRADDAARMFAEGLELFTSRTRFVWTWFHGASDAEMLYEQAAALATMGRETEALDTLRAAGEACWADVPTMRSDPSFAQLRDTQEMRWVTAEAAARVTLPPPIGSGGLG